LYDLWPQQKIGLLKLLSGYRKFYLIAGRAIVNKELTRRLVGDKIASHEAPPHILGHYYVQKHADTIQNK